MDFYQACTLRYRSKANKHDLINLMNDRLNDETENITPELLYIFDYILSTEPCYYWNEDVRKQTIMGLEDLYSANTASITLNYETLEHFLIGYYSYIQLSDVINDLSALNDNEIIKNRMYRIPTYVSIVEGCLTNLFRFIILVLNDVSKKDFSSQKKLKSLCDVLSSNGFDKLTKDVDIDIRNAINHGGVLFRENGKLIEFHYTKDRKIATKTLRNYELDDLLNNVYDLASGVLLGISQFLNNHIELVSIDRNENSYVSFSLLCMELSIPTILCNSISESIDKRQLNINIEIENTDRTFILQTAIEIAIQVFKIYPDYYNYMISFNNDRLPSSWVRFTYKDINDMLHRKRELGEVAQAAIKRQDVVIFDASTEDVNMSEIKYHRYLNFTETDYSIKNVQDVSLEDRKRIKANLFVGNTEDKSRILDIINESINWLKYIENVPNPKMKVKNGDMEADSLYMNVYKWDSRKNKDLYINNENFICMVDYNKDGITTLKNGGLPIQLWNKYYHEKIDRIQIAWRTKQYSLKSSGKFIKVGRNNPCPCGSRKKFKNCCLTAK